MHNKAAVWIRGAATGVLLAVLFVPQTAFGWQVFNTNTGSAGTVAVRTAPTSNAGTLYNITLGAGGILSTGETAYGYASFIGGTGLWRYVNDGRGWGWSFDEGGGYDTYYYVRTTAAPTAAPTGPANGSYTTARRPTVNWSASDDAYYPASGASALDIMWLHMWKATGGDVANGNAGGGARSWAPGGDLASGLYYWTVQPHSTIDGQGGAFATQSFFVDYIAPSTASTVKDGYSGSAAITLTGADDTGGSGIAAVYYKLDSGAQASGTSVKTSVRGAHSLEYWSSDVAGNTGAHVTKSFAVYATDTVSPHTSASISGSYPGTAAITLKPTDNTGGSGVSHTYYKMDSGTTVEGGRATFTVVGAHKLVYWSVDRVGNTETQHTATVTIAPPKAGPPSVSRTTVTHMATTLTISGYISCRYSSTVTPVRIAEYYRSTTSKPWVYKKTLKLKVSSATSGRSYYKVSGALPTRGYWRFQVYTIRDSTHLASALSGWSRVVHAR